MPKTQLLYLPEFDVLAADAEVLECRPDDDGVCLVTDQTVFYPGGGGQPADTGRIIFNGSAMPLTGIGLDQEGIVTHRIESAPGDLKAGATVHMQVDADTRQQHCRLHSAGHVIDLAVHRLGYDWTPTKGAHFPSMSFVEYETDHLMPEGAKEAIQAQCDQLIATGSTNTIQFVAEDGRPLTSPALGHLDAERIVAYDDFRVACGGTHVADIAAIGTLVIRKAKKKKNVIKVSYTVEPL